MNRLGSTSAHFSKVPGHPFRTARVTLYFLHSPITASRKASAFAAGRTRPTATLMSPSTSGLRYH
jgi:hypothetical protein